jgi:hypothetical protein
MNYAEMHERLLAWASAPERQEALLAARKAWFERFGEPHEEDRSYESRMNALLDFYLFDFRPDGVDTTLEAFLRAGGGSALPTDELARFRELSGNLHSLFEVRRLKPGQVRLRDVVTGEDHEVVERRAMAGVTRGDLLEARLVPVSGRLHFSGAFLYHPPEARKAILAEVKRLRKEAGRRGRPDVPALLARLSRMAFKLERYRNVKVESIYDFSESGPASAGR